MISQKRQPSEVTSYVSEEKEECLKIGRKDKRRQAHHILYVRVTPSATATTLAAGSSFFFSVSSSIVQPFSGPLLTDTKSLVDEIVTFFGRVGREMGLLNFIGHLNVHIPL